MPLIVWLGVGLVALIVSGLFVLRALEGSPVTDADIGELEEPAWTLAPDVPLPELGDATTAWNLDSIGLGGDVDAVAGGAAVADMDRDGDLDLIVANGRALVIPWQDGSFGPPIDLASTSAVAVSAADIDEDGWVDVLVAQRGEDDLIVWGGEWIVTGSAPDVTALASGDRSSALLAAELSGDSHVDVLRLGLGTGDGQPDVLWVADPQQPRAFEAVTLPSSDRPSLAGEIADFDGDGLIDMWITRDIGWEAGADSLLSRKGDPSGPWFDIAGDLGTALEVDGMGVTIADLDGDGVLDAYVSDIGDNELLVRRGTGFEPLDGSGAARVRPPGAAKTVVSSSWASGATDVNLDGRLDLVVANGGFPDGDVPNKIPGTAIALDEPPAIFLGDGSGRFVDTWPVLGLDVSVVARGMTIADLDGDGDDDMVLVRQDGQLLALRNDVEAPSLTIRAAAACHVPGAVVDVIGSDSGYRSLLAPHTYAGAHGVDAIVGTRGEPVSVSVAFAGRTPVVRSVSGSERRLVEVFSC